MKKPKFGLVTALLVGLLLLGDFLYWTHGIGLGSQLPGKYWSEAELWYWNESFVGSEILLDQETYGRIAAALEAERVTNRPKFSTMSQPYFHLVLYGPEGATNVTVVESGDIAVNLPEGRTRCYDGGRELYEVLLELKG